VCFRVGVRHTIAFGAWLATRGPLAKAGIVLAALGTVASLAAAAALARRGGDGAEHLPGIVALAQTWGAGTMIAFAAAVHAVRRDREEGLLALARARGIGVFAYARARLGGLSAVVAVAVGVPTLLASLAATAAGHATAAVARASLGALTYTVAFSVVIGPVALAALGARTRAGGYLTLLAVLVLPELLAPWTARLLPPGWDELTSIPAALDALRAGVQAPVREAEELVRAIVGLAAVVGVSLLLVASRLADTPEGPA
jgi:hypothetical protein